MMESQTTRMNAILVAEHAEPMLLDLLAQAGLTVHVTPALKHACRLASLKGARFFFYPNTTLSDITTLQQAIAPKQGYFVEIQEGEDSNQDYLPDDILTYPCSLKEVRACVRTGVRLLDSLEQASQMQRELLFAQEEVKQTEEYRLTVTSQLVEMTAQLQSEMLKNQEMEAERIKLARMDTILQATATLRHEINNPLFAIKGSAEGALRQLQRLNSQEVREIRTSIERVERVMRGAERIQQVVEAFAKVVVPTTKDYLPGMPMLELHKLTEASDPPPQAKAS
jgi:signal transduction histidine kinase